MPETRRLPWCTRCARQNPPVRYCSCHRDRNRSSAWCSTRRAVRPGRCALRSCSRILVVLTSGGPPFGSFREPYFDRVPDLRGNIDPIEPRDLLDAGRRGDIDLCQPVADYIDPDKDEPLRTQGWPDRVADLPVALARFGFHRSRSDMEI